MLRGQPDLNQKRKRKSISSKPGFCFARPRMGETITPVILVDENEIVYKPVAHAPGCSRRNVRWLMVDALTAGTREPDQRQDQEKHELRIVAKASE
jgi:hypothetical protein